jgi:hypothetical protein
MDSEMVVSSVSSVTPNTANYKTVIEPSCSEKHTQRDEILFFCSTTDSKKFLIRIGFYFIFNDFETFKILYSDCNLVCGLVIEGTNYVRPHACRLMKRTENKHKGEDSLPGGLGSGKANIYVIYAFQNGGTEQNNSRNQRKQAFHEEYHLLRCDVVRPSTNLQTFRRDVLPSFSVSSSELKLLFGCFFRLLFDPEDRGRTSL